MVPGPFAWLTVNVAYRGKTDRKTRVSNWWNEQLFKQRMAEKRHMDEGFPIRVEMYDKLGQRQHEFAIRADWQYEITHDPPAVETESWRTMSVRVVNESGETVTLRVHPQCTREDLARDIRKALGTPAE
jgi:hypothetical protein